MGTETDRQTDRWGGAGVGIGMGEIIVKPEGGK